MSWQLRQNFYIKINEKPYRYFYTIHDNNLKILPLIPFLLRRAREIKPTYLPANCLCRLARILVKRLTKNSNKYRVIFDLYIPHTEQQQMRNWQLLPSRLY